jgi:NAD(P)-dependent dehydrogenase (short-subunit alcohol dehydrogenase family)
MSTEPGLEKYFDLNGKVAVVTGAAGQLGGQYVKTLLSAGASVAALDIDFGNPKSILGTLGSDRLRTYAADITDRKGLETILRSILSSQGSPAVLVNNAAIDVPPGGDGRETGPFEDYSEASWDRIMEVNLKGMFLCCQVFGGHMAGSGGGSVINISSIYGMLSPDQRIYRYHLIPFFKPVTYSVSKAGVLNLTRYLATYWAPSNVRVNTLTLAGVFNHQAPAFLENYTGKVPLGRMAREDEYNAAILFLSSEASSYMTGSNLVIDGGYSCW